MKRKNSRNTQLIVMVVGGIVAVLAIGAIIAGMSMLNDEQPYPIYIPPPTNVPPMLEDPCGDLLPAQIAIGDTVEIENTSNGITSIRLIYSYVSDGNRRNPLMDEDFTSDDTGLVLDGPECVYNFNNNYAMRMWLLEKPNGTVGWVHEYDTEGTRNPLIPVSD